MLYSRNETHWAELLNRLDYMARKWSRKRSLVYSQRTHYCHDPSGSNYVLFNAIPYVYGEVCSNSFSKNGYACESVSLMIFSCLSILFFFLLLLTVDIKLLRRNFFIIIDNLKCFRHSIRTTEQDI